jgi:predicted transcriptional regulator
MATTLRPETEQKLAELAESMHRPKDEVVDEALDCQAAYNKWLEGKVREGLKALKRGEVVPDEEVLAWIEERERS